jgi:hypothetical protein
LGYNKIKIKEEYIMEKVINEAKRLWTLAAANKKVTIGVVIAIIIVYELATR